LSGFFCGAEACNFAFHDLSVMADVPSLMVDKCIETKETIASFPTVAPGPSPSFDYPVRFETITSFPTVAPGPSPSFDYSVRFEASWAIRYDSDASITTCNSANPTLIVVCENDARIEFVTATDTSMNCTEIGSSELRCMGDVSTITNQFTSIFYVSTGIHDSIHPIDSCCDNQQLCHIYTKTLNSMFSC
jgi:hypothetical protein